VQCRDAPNRHSDRHLTDTQTDTLGNEPSVGSFVGVTSTPNPQGKADRDRLVAEFMTAWSSVWGEEQFPKYSKATLQLLDGLLKDYGFDYLKFAFKLMLKVGKRKGYDAPRSPIGLLNTEVAMSIPKWRKHYYASATNEQLETEKPPVYVWEYGYGKQAEQEENAA
jgi:hypothetical protein